MNQTKGLSINDACLGCGFYRFKSDRRCNKNDNDFITELRCNNGIIIKITEQQFNDTPGIKYSIKNGVRTELLGDDQEYADAIIIMEDKK